MHSWKRKHQGNIEIYNLDEITENELKTCNMGRKNPNPSNIHKFSCSNYSERLNKTTGKTEICYKNYIFRNQNGSTIILYTDVFENKENY